MTTSDDAVGLRERSKNRRRAAILNSAMRLFAERGYDETTIADIADDAEVARRTVIGYFPNKVDLATAFADELTEGLAALYAADPHRGVVEALDLWLDGLRSTLDREQAALASAMYARNPGLRALSGARAQQAVDAIGTEFAAGLGLPVGHPLLLVYGGVLSGAATAYLGVIFAGDATDELHRSVIAMLRRMIEPVVPPMSRRGQR